MKAIFIAAGQGSRLGDITKDLPKPLIDVNGKSIIQRQIDLLRQNNIHEIIIVTGYKKEKFTFENIEYVHNPLYREQEQVGSLMSARSKFTDDILVMFGDIIFDEKILQQILNSKGEIIKDGKVIQISAKNIEVKNDNDIGELLGLMKLSTKGSEILIEQYEKLENSHTGKFHDAASLKKAKFVDILQELISLGIIITPVYIEGKWCEIDTPYDLKRAKNIFP